MSYILATVRHGASKKAKQSHAITVRANKLKKEAKRAYEKKYGI